jgi:hypothetical protein
VRKIEDGAPNQRAEKRKPISNSNHIPFIFMSAAVNEAVEAHKKHAQQTTESQSSTN